MSEPIRVVLVDLCQFTRDLQSSLEPGTLADLLANTGSRKRDIRTERERVVLNRPFQPIAVEVLQVMELGETRQIAFAL